MKRDRIREAIIFVSIMWAIHAVDFILPLDLNEYGLVPRSFRGLLGIVTMPFLHASWGHLLGNTIPLFILLILLSAMRSDRLEIMTSIIVLGGILLWCFGRSAVHVGASGLIYGLVAFLTAFGFLSRNIVSVLVSLIVGFMYGTTLLSGILPSLKTQVSWDGHLFGAVAGITTAYMLATYGSKSEVHKNTGIKAADIEKS